MDALSRNAYAVAVVIVALVAAVAVLAAMDVIDGAAAAAFYTGLVGFLGGGVAGHSAATARADRDRITEAPFHDSPY